MKTEIHDGRAGPVNKKRVKFVASDWIGKRFGTLVVLGCGGGVGCYRKLDVRCDCGRLKSVSFQSLRNGLVESCGYAPCRAGTTGVSKNPLYRMWWYLRSVGKLAVEWNEFSRFVADVAPKRLTRRYLIRPDTDKPLGPDNFSWSNRKLHGPNMKAFVTINGVTKLSSEWQRELGVNRERVRQLKNKSAGLCQCGRPLVDGDNNCQSPRCDSGKLGLNRIEARARRIARKAERDASRIAFIERKIAEYTAELTEIRNRAAAE